MDRNLFFFVFKKYEDRRACSIRKSQTEERAPARSATSVCPPQVTGVDWPAIMAGAAQGGEAAPHGRPATGPGPDAAGLAGSGSNGQLDLDGGATTAAAGASCGAVDGADRAAAGAGAGASLVSAMRGGDAGAASTSDAVASQSAAEAGGAESIGNGHFGLRPAGLSSRGRFLADGSAGVAAAVDAAGLVAESGGVADAGGGGGMLLAG